MQSPEAPPASNASAADRLSAAWGQLRSGAVGVALQELTALDESPASPRLTGVERARTLALLLDCRLARGDLSEAMTLGDRLSPFLEEGGQAAAIAHYAQGDLAAALGEPETATVHFLAAGAAAADLPEDPELLPWRSGAALVMVRTGARREASRLAAEQHVIALRHHSTYAIATALRTLATVDGGGQRVPLLREALAVLAHTRAERLTAQVHADLAGMLLLTNDPDDRVEALALLRKAELYAGRHELWPLQGRVRRMLDRCGEAPLRVTSEALAILTTTERRVAGLAAEGLTNRQIAEQLLVSVKAVEWHLSRTYRKLGITSRSGLALTFGVPA